jgi:hypothetical protein
MAVIPDELGIHVPLTAKQPEVMFTPFAIVVVPLPEMEKRVVVPVFPAVDEAIEKMRLVFARPELSWIESFEAAGVVVPIARRPAM